MPHYKIILLLCLSVLCGCSKPETPLPPKKEPQRIVTTVPSITEVFFELGLGDRVVGVSRFCKYPKETQKIPKIGGLLDRDNESILRLEPDLIVELDENITSRQFFEDFGVSVLTVDHKTVDGVLDSFTQIGSVFDEATRQKAKEVRQNLLEQLEAVEKRTQSQRPVRTLICVDRERGTGSLLSVYVVGKNPYYERALQIAGGINVAQDASSAFPVVGIEDIVRMNPEVILDLYTTYATDSAKSGNDNGLADWFTLGKNVDAVKNHRVYVITDDYATIPGPRVGLYVQKIADLLRE